MSTLFHTNPSKINSITPDDNEYTQIIVHIAKCPKRLWYIGTLPTQRKVSLAIVGTRGPTTYGQEMAYKLSYDLARQGVIIISGLALGIDCIAHQAALDAGGITIAVLPTSLDNIHPRTNQKLAEDIISKGGALITEYPSGSKIYKGNFLERNRIVSGLSDGLLIIEASSRSGTLATTNFALDQGKSVMAVPGNANSLTSVGCNNLLKFGATVVTEVSDVLQELGLQESTVAEQPIIPLIQASSAEQQSILQLILDGVHDGEDLQIQSQLEPSLFNQTLTMLEIENKIHPRGANQWSL
ncbi:MAG TPA: DNA-processing protein DprA [Patescibacteria group bacterium]|jgi:DNA processing protein|nr:DNA-processing protein DprA [Patescibacteria group bacterium]